jgi:hypothetical protein
MAGEYAELVRRAQADDDAAHRQQAMDRIAIIGPMVGMDTTAADAAAAPVIARLYPADPLPDTRAAIAAIEARARAQIGQIIADYRQKAALERTTQAPVTASSESES